MREIYDYSNVKKWYLEDNVTIREIAQRVGCKWRAIYHYLERNGIARKGRTESNRIWFENKHAPYYDIIKECYEKDVPLREIAKRTHIGAYSIAKIAKKLGLKPKSFSGRVREKSSNWKGGYKSYHGYIRIRMPEHPYAASDGYVPQHRLVMEQKLGRYLLPSEHVHHRDGNKSNNDIENLLLISPANHKMVTEFCDKCPLKTEIAKLERQLRQAQKTCQLMLEQNNKTKEENK